MSAPPFNPPDVAGMIGLGGQGRKRGSSMLDALQNRRQQELDALRLQEAQRQQANDARNQALNLVKMNVKPESAAQLTNVDPAFIDVLKTVSKTVKEQEKAAKQQQFQQHELPAARSTVASANLAPTDPRLQSALVALNERFSPEQLRMIESEAAGVSGGVREERQAQSQAERRRADLQVETESRVEAVRRRSTEIEAAAERARVQGDVKELTRQGVPERIARAHIRSGGEDTFVDPITGRLLLGDPEGKRAERASSFSSIMSLSAQAEGLAEEFARETGDRGPLAAFTGTLEEAQQRFGMDASPTFAAYNALQSQFALILARARSGAQMNEREIEQLEKAFPKVGEIRIVDGRLSSSARAKFKAMDRVLRNEVLPLYTGYNKSEVNKDIRSMRESAKSQIRADLGEVRAIPVPGQQGGTPVRPGEVIRLPSGTLTLETPR